MSDLNHSPIIAIEEHWMSDAVDAALRAQPAGARDDSVVLNDRGDIPRRLSDIGEGRVAAMDEAGIDQQILSIAPPGAWSLPAVEAVALCREANDQASRAVTAFPNRFAAMTTLPMGDPGAAVAELERSADLPGHVGVMAYCHSAGRRLDDPAFDEVMALAARLRRPIFIHPQIPPAAVRQASYSGLGDTLDLALATFGWGWHAEAGLTALRLILAGTFDRHPELQIVLGHWGEMLLFALDRADSLSNVAPDLRGRVADYVATNVHIAVSGMLVPRLLEHALDFTSVDRILLSGDYPFHRIDRTAVTEFLRTLPDAADRERLAHLNAERLYGLASPTASRGERA